MASSPRWKRHAAVATILAAAAGGLQACGSSGSSGADDAPSVSASGDLVIDGETIADKNLVTAARKEGHLTLYTTQLDDPQKALDAQFEKDTGVKVTYFRDAGATLTQRILAEAAGGVHSVDDIVLTSPSDMAALDAKHLLASYVPATLGDHDAAKGEVGPDHKWYPNSVTLFVLGVNTAVAGEGKVKTWDDAVSSQFKGKIGITPAGVGGSGVAQAAFEKEVLGDDYPAKLGAADPVIFDSTVTVAQNLASGDLSVAIAGEPALAPLKSQGAPIDLVYPDQGVIGVVGYEAIAAQAPDPNAARLYHDWLLSKHGQEEQAKLSQTRSIRDDVDDPGMTPARSSINVWMSNLTDRMGTADQLVAAWNKAVGYSG